METVSHYLSCDTYGPLGQRKVHWMKSFHSHYFVNGKQSYLIYTIL